MPQVNISIDTKESCHEIRRQPVRLPGYDRTVAVAVACLRGFLLSTVPPSPPKAPHDVSCILPPNGGRSPGTKV